MKQQQVWEPFASKQQQIMLATQVISRSLAEGGLWPMAWLVVALPVLLPTI